MNAMFVWPDSSVVQIQLQVGRGETPSIAAQRELKDAMELGRYTTDEAPFTVKGGMVEGNYMMYWLTMNPVRGHENKVSAKFVHNLALNPYHRLLDCEDVYGPVVVVKPIPNPVQESIETMEGDLASAYLHNIDRGDVELLMTRAHRTTLSLKNTKRRLCCW